MTVEAWRPRERGDPESVRSGVNLLGVSAPHRVGAVSARTPRQKARPTDCLRFNEAEGLSHLRRGVRDRWRRDRASELLEAVKCAGSRSELQEQRRYKRKRKRISGLVCTPGSVEVLK